MTVAQIAETAKAPPSYLSKVMQALNRAGLVKSQRGIHGGFVLSRSVGRISVLDVINAVDPIQRIRSCPLGLADHGVALCPLHRKLDEAIAHVENVFAGYAISDLLSESAEGAPLGLCSPATADLLPPDTFA
ncbi:MAG: RrF2 family transcriptional regulator [Candidatus Sumerlaeia bacterium]